MYRLPPYAACVLACVLLLHMAPARADGSGNADTYTPAYDRPGFGFGTSALPWGGFAIEQGLPTWSQDNQGGVRTNLFMTDSLLRVGLGNGLEFQLGSTPFNWLGQRAAGVSQFARGSGDTVLSLKVAPPSSSSVWSWGVLGTVELPDGAQAIRLPQRQYTLGVTVSQQLDDKNSLGYFAQWQRMGNQGTDQIAGNYGYALSKTWGVYGEMVGMHQQRTTGALLGAGMTYLPNARLQWDLSFDRRVIGSATTWMADFGVAFYFTL